MKTTYEPVPCFTALGDGFFDPVAAARFPEHRLRYRNQRWAARVGLDELTEDEWERHFAAFQPLPDNLPTPLALRYHGHQFMSYNPELGDGRGFLFAQLRDNRDSRLLDLATKGSGQTPWSRSGDGRLTLKGGVREILATEQLEALGVYTSKSFSLFETGEKLYRGDEPSPTRSSVLVRLGHCHIRFGSFQRHAAARDAERIERLVDFTIEHYMPDLSDGRGQGRAIGLFQRVCDHTAMLGASWMAAGFVHGVLNTDNCNVTGESFDYGPYRFLPTYDPNFVAAYFDHSGLYAFGRQPAILGWNLAQLASALTLVCDKDALQEVGQSYRLSYESALRAKVLERLGLAPREPELDQVLLDHVLAFLADSQVGYDQFFFDWYAGVASEERAGKSPETEKYTSDSFRRMRDYLKEYEPTHPERLDLPYFQGRSPCSLLIEEIERIWAAIAERDDWSLFDAKLEAIGSMRAALR